MPDFNQQRRIIAQLREECRAGEESLYRARLGLDAVTRQLERARQGQTIPNPQRDQQAGNLRQRMAALDARLAALRAEQRRLADGLAQWSAQRNLSQQLGANIETTRARAMQLRHQLAALREQEAPPVDEIDRLEGALRGQEQALADLEARSQAAEAGLRDLQDQAAGQRERQSAIQAEIAGLREELQATQRRLAELLRPAFGDVQALEARQRELQKAVQTGAAGQQDCRRALDDAIGGLYGDLPHPKDSLPNITDRIPFLLFPLRIETIFVPAVGQGAELWVRVYPDEIAVHTHEKTLTDREVQAGELYWTELVAAAHLSAEGDPRRAAAWGHLVDLFGGQRAAWVARETKPSDWDALSAAGPAQSLPDFLRSLDPAFFTHLLALDLPAGTRAALQKALADNDGDAFMRLSQSEGWGDRVDAAVRQAITGFPPHDLTKTDAWTRAPRTQIMPDRLVLLLYADENAAPREIVGSLIPDTLYLGPDPQDAAAAYPIKDGARTYGSDFAWMSDFDQAIAKGMGFRVPLSPAEASAGFAKILVLGLRLSADEQASALMLEELVDDHQYSPQGFSIVPQGTPSNNTEADGSGYSDNDAYDALAFFTALDPPAFDPASPDPRRSQADGRLLADALGIAYTPLQTVRHADQADILEARLLNTALFPGTLGYWLRTWMAPLVSDETARQARDFFTHFVSGRGPLPTVRVGNQPYGVLLTSDFSRWKYPDSGVVIPLPGAREQLAFLKGLSGLLTRLQQSWDNLAAGLPFTGRPGADADATLMHILGLQPTSAEFYQRVGYSSEFLSNLDAFINHKRYANELASLVTSMPPTARLYLQSLGITADLAEVRQMRSLRVLWQHFVTALDAANLVDNKPLSETKTLAPNYIDWLYTAENTQKIIDQSFPGPLPSALLYLMLRNALLLQLHNGAYDWLAARATFDPTLQSAIQLALMPGIRAAAPSVSKYELMGVHVETVEPAHPLPGVSAADWIWNGPRPAEIEAAFLRDQKDALHLLADLPTARLERVFVEHLDCCTYRLDAWQTGLFVQRLFSQRAANSRRDGQQRAGIFIGAFGWVEDLRPAAKVFIDPQQLPAALRPADARPVLEEDDAAPLAPGEPQGAKQGGFAQAPSLNHAAAAALLRSAYLSHANPAQAELFSVNLSSERVRRGQFILEGMRNGQPIEALLGYQFERQLHDITSRSAARGDVPVLELNEFILPYREAFPFTARELPQAGAGPAAEAVPAYSVVNGLSLAQAALTAINAYGLADVLPVDQRPDANQGAAIVAAQNALLDTIDAVKDLLMAENAYQLVRGNFDRVAAVSLAQKEARIPPRVEVIDTPRGSSFTFTNRVTLHFADLDPTLPASNPWPAIPLTPRAWAETGLNHWLGSVLGTPPDKIRCEVYWVEKPQDDVSQAHDLHPLHLADLGLQPVDFIWLAGVPEESGGASELETRIAWRYRADHAIPNERIVRIAFNPSPPAGEKTFAQFFPLARYLRLIISRSRPLHAGDFLPASGGKATAVVVDKNNPLGYDAAELHARVQSALDALTLLANALDGPSAPVVDLTIIPDPANPAVNETFSGPLGAAFDKLEAARLSFTDAAQVQVTFLFADALHATLRVVAGYGLSDAFPPESELSSAGAKAALLARAMRVARRLRRKTPADGALDHAGALIAQAAPALPIEQQVSLLLAAGKALFGETFDWLPRFTCYNEVDLAAADADRTQLLQHARAQAPGLTDADVVEEWLLGAARVRPALHRWEMVRTLADALNDVSLELRPVQVPYRANDSWLAVAFPEKDPNPPPDDPNKPFGISRDTLSIAAHGETAFQPATRQCGLLIDDWTEEIPTTQEITGIAFRFNRPNAEPPQVLLLAVTPEETGAWNWDALVGTLTDTLRRAKRRAVEPDQLEQQLGSVWNAFAPALVSEFSALASADISLDVARMLDYAALNQFYASKMKAG